MFNRKSLKLLFSSAATAGVYGTYMEFETARDIQNKLDQALTDYENGDARKALDQLSKLVMDNPNCKVCRYHMGKIATEVKSLRQPKG